MSILWFSNISFCRSLEFQLMRRRWEILCHFQKLIKASCWWPFEHPHTLYYYYDINKHKDMPPLFSVLPHSFASALSYHHHHHRYSLNKEKLIKVAFKAFKRREGRTNRVCLLHLIYHPKSICLMPWIWEMERAEQVFIKRRFHFYMLKEERKKLFHY